MWTTSPSALWLALACEGEADPPSYPPSTWPEDDRELEPQEDTGLPPSGRDTAPAAPCDGEPRTATVVAWGNDEGDNAGWEVDAADMDSDGCAEALVTEPYYFGILDQTYRRAFSAVRTRLSFTAVHVLRWPYAEGSLHQVAWASVVGSRPTDGLGITATLLPSEGQVATDGMLYTTEPFALPPNLFAFPGSGPTVLGAGDQEVWFGESQSLEGLGRCSAPGGGAALCIGSVGFLGPGSGDGYAGAVFVHPLPLDAARALEGDALAFYRGDPFERAEVVAGEGDLDGDGTPDLAIGAYEAAAGVGRVVVVLDPPSGDHELTAIGSAVLAGVVPGGQFGLSVTTGDLDGDGIAAVCGGAPLGAPSEAYVFRGPFAGARSAEAADWSVPGGAWSEWVGFDSAIGDFDGDGSPDLAVAAPWSIYFATEPGRVAVWSAPAPGVLDLDAPTWTLVSGAATPDAFGKSLAAGDLDGDGRSDLVVGAPIDSRAGDFTGSVTLVFGASLL